MLLIATLLACTPPQVLTAEPTPPPASPSPLGATSTSVLEPTPTLSGESGIEIGPEALAGLSLEFWHVWDGEEGEMIGRWVQEFNSSNPYELQVEVEVHPNIVADTTNAISAENPPNLVVGLNYHVWLWDADAGNVVDLSVYYLDSQYGLDSNERADFIPLYWGQETFGGKQYGVPMYRTGDLLLYNQVWASELGFDGPPETFEDLREQACAASTAIREDENPLNDGRGGLILTSEPGSMLVLFLSFGGAISGIEEGEAYRFNRQEISSTLEALNDMLREGCAWVPDGRYANAEFAQREALFYPTTLGAYTRQKNEQGFFGRAEEWMIIPFPSESGSPFFVPSGPAYTILKSTPEEALAGWLFLRWLSRIENQAEWTQLTAYLPVRRSVQDLIVPFASENPVWTAAAADFPTGKTVRVPETWGSVMWVFRDALGQFLKPGFPAENLPALLDELDRTADEVDRLTP